MRDIQILILLSLMTFSLSGQKLIVSDPYLQIEAEHNDPLYTTYAASPERSRLYGDRAYVMDYYSGSKTLTYSSEKAGNITSIWMINKLAIMSTDQFYERPIVKASFPDMSIVEYQPMKGIYVQETFLVYSSTLSLIRLHVENNDTIPHLIDLYPVFELENENLELVKYDGTMNAYITLHKESKKRLISNLYENEPYIEDVRDLFMVDFQPHSYGAYPGHMKGFYNTIKTDWYDENRVDSLNMLDSGKVNFVSIQGRFLLEPGEVKEIEIYKGWQGQDETIQSIYSQINQLQETSLQYFVNQNVQMFNSIPKIHFNSEDEKLVYLGSFNLVRSCILPPTGKTSYNYYVFSREPKWGWGHGHQVLHESLSMMAYAYLDPLSAQNSQRVFMEQQREDGLIAYRHGPRGAQTYPHKGMPTTSAPFYSWINWEIYEVSRDIDFLEDAYNSGRMYVNWLKGNRDTDKDGLFEWGPYGIIENVRDWYNVIFQVSKERYLDVDKEDISDELECLDLSLMLVKEMRSLGKMAAKLNKNNEAREWDMQANKLSDLINKVMWDEESEFFFHVDKVNHEFEFMERNLKRPEIIGFLPLWAEAVSQETAVTLLHSLTDTNTFWRKYGIPTLSASDPYYNPNVDYCCKWNGPVWLLWNYMIFDGLKNYGFDETAKALAEKMILAVKTQLSLNHRFWESYSPDNEILNCPSNYIWDAIMAKLLIEVYIKDNSKQP